MNNNKKNRISITLLITQLALKMLPKVCARFLYRFLSNFSWARKLIKKTFSLSIPDTIIVAGVTVALNKNDPVVSGSLAAGYYENGELCFFKSRVKPGMTVIDIGANVGCFSAVASLAVESGGRVLSFEPDPVSFKYLLKTAKLSPFGNIFCHQLAAGDRNGTTKLFLSEINAGDNRLYETKKAAKAVIVNTVALDDFMQKLGIARIDVVKMDVQGYEGYVLNGMRKIIASNQNIQLFTEFCPSFLDKSGFGAVNFFNSLRFLGFDIYLINSKKCKIGKIVNNIEPIIKKCAFEGFFNFYCKKG